MCGLVGCISYNKVSADQMMVMMNQIVHRGPDSFGLYSDRFFHMGMRRLSINGLEDGDQPLYNQDKTVAVMYNGEIYNYPELRKLLEDKGVRFSTHSDGEVIGHLYDFYGEDTFELLDGMFAIALWDKNQNKLLLARDIPGEKPLYYSDLHNGEIAFSSEIKALRKLKQLSLTLDRQAIWDFPSFLWIPEPRTIYKEVKALPRGSYLVADGKSIQVKSYKNCFGEELRTDQNGGDVVARTREIVTEAVKSRLLSDVSVGSFLSGGLDSSIVATIATRELGAIDTFCVAFENLDDPYHGKSDESSDAAYYANLLGANHHEIRVTGKTFFEDLDKFCLYGDQPYAVSSGLGVLSVARAAREAGIKVLLTGDCADECFGGYSWYRYLNEVPKNTAFSESDKIISFQNFGLDINQRLEAMSKYDAQERAWAWHYYAHEKEKADLFSADFREGLKSSHRYFERHKADKHWSPCDYISQDRNFYMPNEMLTKADRMTMAYSVEGRVPFAAPAVLAHVENLTYSDMVKGDTLKWALRQAFNDILPPEVLARPKHGFNVPIDHWLKSDWKSLMNETFSQESALYKEGFIRKNSGDLAEKMLNDPQRLNGHSIFCFIMLNRWLEGIR
jgi:asparagine synthase (glutamine-hydrolysing)